MGSLTEPSIPLAPIETPAYQRNVRDRQWKEFASAICNTDAGRAMVIRGTIKRIKEEEERHDRENDWPGPNIPQPMSYVARTT